MKEKLVSLEDALAPVTSGSTIAIGGSLLRRQPNAAIRSLIRRGVTDLTVQTWAATTATDMLAAAGALRRYEGIYTGMFSYGLAPNFRRAVESGAIEVRDFSETAMVARFRAATQGLAFLPIKTLLGSDIANKNPEQFRPFSCPFTGEKLQAVAAATSDFTIIHGYAGDKYGNVQWPVVRDSDDIDQMIASAGKRVIVTVEKIIPHEEVKKRPTLTYIPGNWVEAIVEVPYGAHPVSVDAMYDEDDAHLTDYLERSRSAEGAAAYLDEYARAIPSHSAYIAKVGGLAALNRLDVQPNELNHV
ncbi:CoA transferase subunit A [Azospirillum rugosum]|uniref:Glutaconate CoA-transferase subunit A n=1 Tax=Azospirillum rugosum TaxID=416170 RepID=A0ABS4SW66_9PROT|nr:CoA-transferase [Azospirillum rugosum]MBP2296811.1 glutaconate CoA-transferase subunit A [Azospirillum rugosum]MDQ0530414.1 glutaconate CoA-transferase subunit A [Azospirillum rugosum]